MNEEQQRDQDALYRGIGRFFVSFSQLVGHMEAGIISMAGIGQGQDTIRAWQLGLTGIEARSLTNLFFGVAATSITLTREEKLIHQKLRGRVEYIIEERNGFAHGTWYVGSSTGAGEPSFKEAFVTYSKLSPNTAIVPKDRPYTAAGLESVCDEIDELRGLVWEFASGCVDPQRAPRPGLRLELTGPKNDRKVRRRSLEGWTPPTPPTQPTPPTPAATSGRVRSRTDGLKLLLFWRALLRKLRRK